MNTTMMKSSINNLLVEMNMLQKQANRFGDKSYEKYQAGNEKASAFYERKQDEILAQIKGIEKAFHILGLGVWKDAQDIWSIPLDDIQRVC